MLLHNETTIAQLYTDFTPIAFHDFVLYFGEGSCSENIFFRNHNVHIPHSGIISCGKMAEQEVFIDNKGRILIPKKAREQIGLLTGGKARLKVEKEKIIIMPQISPDAFIKEMEGCIKEGAPTINPLALKKICDPKT